MSLDRHIRTPLTVGLLALTGVIGLSGCVPTVEDDSSDSGQSEETEAASSEETQAEETQAEETPSEEASDDASEEASDDASEEASEEASEKPSEDASEDASEKPSGDASSKSEDAAPAGDLVDASKLSGEPIEVVEGEGDGTVEIPEHDEPLVVVFENTSKDEFSYLYGTADPGQSLDGAETGETVIFLLDPYGYNGGLDSNTKKWKMEGDASDTFLRYNVAGTELNRPRIAELLDRSLMLVTALNPKIGYDNAAKVAKKALADGATIRDTVIAMGFVERGEVTEAQLDEALDVESMTHP